MGYLKNHWWKRWIRRRGCKLAGGPASVGKRTTLVLEERVELGHLRIVPPRLEIGAYSYVRSGTDLSLVASIGRFCSIGSDCFIGQEKHTHPSDWVSSHPFQHTGTALRYEPALSYAEIGHDVWIGHSAMVMEGVKVGTGAIIATRAVVTSRRAALCHRRRDSGAGDPLPASAGDHRGPARLTLVGAG